MIKGKLEGKDGKVLVEFDMPESLHEVPLNRYIDFIIEVEKADKSGSDAITHMARAVCSFYGFDLQTVFDAAMGNIEHDPHDIEQAKAETISGLFMHASKLIERGLNAFGTSPVRDGKFTFVGKEYKITQNSIFALVHGENGKPETKLTVMEAIEALEANRVCEVRTKEEGDPNGDFVFAKYLRLLAVFCRENGEDLPFDEMEREAYIIGAAARFGGQNETGEIIPASIALDVDFFLTSFSGRFKQTLITPTFLTAHSLAIIQLTQQVQKRTPRQLRMQNRTQKRHLGVQVGAALSGRSLRRAISRAKGKQK